MYFKLKNLITFISKRDSKPRFIFVGDYINKGPDSKKVLDFLKKLNLKFECVFILGNHEFFLLNSNLYKRELAEKGGNITLKNFQLNTFDELSKHLLQEYDFIFKKFKLYYIISDYVVSHSGINPRKIKLPLNHMDMSDFLFNRIDFLKYNKKYLNKYKFIFGHTAFNSVFYDGVKIGIDTGACYDRIQPLTCFCVEKSIFVDSFKREYNIASIKKNTLPLIIMK